MYRFVDSITDRARSRAIPLSNEPETGIGKRTRAVIVDGTSVDRGAFAVIGRSVHGQDSRLTND